MNQVKSKQRVADHGEVFTSDREVNAMLDLIKQETERVDSRFLEPACGTGNFLIEILRRKMDVIFKSYGKSQIECEKYIVQGVGSVYGIDLLEDNVEECRHRLFDLFKTYYRKQFKNSVDKNYEKVIRFILSKNIVCGDALTMRTISGTPIIFPEWSLVIDCMVKRRDFSFGELIETRGKQTSIFDAGFYKGGKAEFVPNPVKEYPAVHYRQLIQSE